MPDPPRPPARALERLERCRNWLGAMPSGSGVPGRFEDVWYAVAASRLGRRPETLRNWGVLLRRVCQRAAEERARLMIVPGTAAARWVEHAAELFGIPTVRLVVAEESGRRRAGDGQASPAEVRTAAPRTAAAPPPIRIPLPDEAPRGSDSWPRRDAALIGLADRIFALHVRRGGAVDRLLRQRLAIGPPGAAAVHVVVRGADDDAAPGLIEAGAVGWWLPESPAETEGAAAWTPTPPLLWLPQCEFLQTSDAVEGGLPDFLVHCTRARQGPWPDESERQYRDQLLRGAPDAMLTSPLEVLRRILIQQRLWGTRRVTRGTEPVVCWSAVPLAELLARRTFRPHLGRWDYEPYGVAIRRQGLERLGTGPVRYLREGETAADEPPERLQPCGRTFDWTAEREWRTLGHVDLSLFGPEEMFVFVPDDDAARRIAPHCRWPIVLTGPGTPRAPREAASSRGA